MAVSDDTIHSERSADDALDVVGLGPAEERTPGGDFRPSPGLCVADRYRLAVFHGGREGLQFWQADDTRLGRQVALTFIDPDGMLPEEYVQEVLSRTVRLSLLDAPGIARVLDVAPARQGAVVAWEWIRGESLREVAGDAPSPLRAARAMQCLTAAAAAAHEAGLALSIDHPGRVRVSVEDAVVLAFPATLPDATAAADLRGMGAVLYTLLANRWPLPESGTPSRLAPAQCGTGVRPKELAAIRSDVPVEISAAVAAALQAELEANNGIGSAAAFLDVLTQASLDMEDVESESASGETDSPERFDFAPAAPSAATDEPEGQPDDPPTRVDHTRVWLALAAVAAAVLLTVVLLGASTLSRIVGFGSESASLDKDGRLGLHQSGSSPPPHSAAVAGRGMTVKPLKATVFSPGGGADNPESAALAIDGNPATAWSTDAYFDAVPFPGFKEGVGLLLQLARPTVLSAVTVDLDSTGTVVSIRSSRTATPARLADTAALTPPTPVHPGHNTIPIGNAAPTSTVLVWISTLGTTGGISRTDISEITLQAVS